MINFSCAKCKKTLNQKIPICYKCYHKYYDKMSYIFNIEKAKKYAKDRYNKLKNNIEFQRKRKEYAKEYRKKYDKKYYKENYEKIRKRGKEYYEKNKYWLNPKNRKKTIERKKTDINCMLRDLLRSRIAGAIKHQKSNKKTLSTILLGASINKVRLYIEKQFKDNMSWKNYGKNGWHIDHIIPCINFDLTKIEEQKKCFHYTNLQPLWAKENLSKGKKIFY